MRPHLAVHGRCDEQRGTSGQGHAGQRVLGEAAGQAGKRGGRSGRDEQQVGAIGKFDMAGAPAFLSGEDGGHDRIFAQGLQGEWRDEALCGVAHDDVDIMAFLDEQAGEVGGFVGRDRAGHAEDKGFRGGHVSSPAR